MNKKRIIIFAILFVIAISLIVGGSLLIKQSTGDRHIEKTKEEKSYKPKETLLKDIDHEQLKITNIDIKKIDGHYEFNFTISNISDKATDVQIINFVFYDEKGQEVGRIENELQSVLANQSTSYIINSKDEKLFKASEIKIELSPLVIE